MAFQLKAKESLSDGITRNVRRQIEKAIDHLGAKRKPHQRGASANEAVPNEVRKCFKKVRAALRLVREELGDDVYREENWCFRDAGRLLSEVRDAVMLVETVDTLASQQFAEAVEPGAFAKIHEALLTNQQEVIRRVVDEDKAFSAVEEAAARAIERLPEWRIEGNGWAALEPGLRRVYRRGHRALALAAENSSVENLHEWRKQAKYLWLQLQLLEAAWTGSEKKLIDQTHKLSRFLGEDHDLAVLRQTLAADPLAYGGHRILKGVFAVIDHRREELERQAFALGRKLYKDSPKVFTRRIGAYGKVGRLRSKQRSSPREVARPRGGGHRIAWLVEARGAGRRTGCKRLTRMLAPRPTKLRSQRDINLWRIPLQLSLAAVALFGITLIPDILDKYGVIRIPSWLTMGSIDDARAILSAMMGAVATVLALIFSVALLVLSMVATLFGPRLLYRFLQDWVTQVTIGLFMGTFIYVCLCFLVTHQDANSRFIPQISLLTSWVLVVAASRSSSTTATGSRRRSRTPT